MLSFSMLFPVPTFPKLMIPLFQDLGDRWERQEKVKFASFLRVSVLLQALVPVFFHDVHQLLKKWAGDWNEVREKRPDSTLFESEVTVPRKTVFLRISS